MRVKMVFLCLGWFVAGAGCAESNSSGTGSGDDDDGSGDSDADSDADADSDSDNDGDADSDTDSDGDSDSDTATGTDADTDVDTDADTDSDTETEGVVVDLAPSTGTLKEGSFGSLDVRGYLVTMSQDAQLIGFEWWIDQPSFGYLSARVYNEVGDLLAAGSEVYGDDVEAWYRSDINYDLVAGQTYSIVFYDSAAPSSTFDNMQFPDMPYEVVPYFTNVESRAIYGDVMPDSTNYWAPMQRVVLAH